jgi:diguanylate cyclase (GGDEF)-like protein
MERRSSLSRIPRLAVPRRIDIQSVVYVLVVAAGALFMVWDFNIFRTAPLQSELTRSAEMSELLVVGAVMAGGMMVFAAYFVRSRHETAQRVAAEREARRLALEDPLTGLPNRRQFEEALKTALGSPPRAGGSHALLLLDLNGFKRINDVHGHPIGDQVLIGVGNRLKAAVRENDLVARLGGDEFAVLAPHLVGPDAAASIALRIADHLKEPIAAHGGRHQVSTAIGISLIPQDAQDAAEVLRKADIALYRAKAQSGAALRFFEAQMDEAIRERDGLERELLQAVEDRDIVPYFQSLVDLETGEIIGFEALARWDHATLGQIEPSRFIPIAEDCGLIGELTNQILMRACAAAMSWPPRVRLSVNVSPVLLRDPGFGLRVLAILGHSGLAPTRLEIEITESALVQDMDSAKFTLGALREAGIRIALDDFGTGYSSLYHLRNFKLDTIKIDRSFVEAMATDPDSAAIVKALIGLGAGLSLAVTAEGVESAQQQSLLAAQGCSTAQGFLFSHAVPAAEALALISGPLSKRA